MGTRGKTTVQELLDRYTVFLLDAYGVLVDGQGALPGAADFVRALKSAGKKVCVVTNDASKSPERISERFQTRGIDIAADEVISSGMLVADYFAEENLEAPRVCVLGTDDSRGYVIAGGGICVSEAEIASGDFDVLAVCDESGYPWSMLDDALTGLMRAVDGGRMPRLILPNPDLIYPMSEGRFGFAAGSIAAMFEKMLRQRYGEGAPGFVPLGKPEPGLLRKGLERVGASADEAVMIGDQVATDMMAAKAAGVCGVLVSSGVERGSAAGGSGEGWYEVLGSVGFGD